MSILERDASPSAPSCSSRDSEPCDRLLASNTLIKSTSVFSSGLMSAHTRQKQFHHQTTSLKQGSKNKTNKMNNRERKSTNHFPKLNLPSLHDPDHSDIASDNLLFPCNRIILILRNEVDWGKCENEHFSADLNRILPNLVQMRPKKCSFHHEWNIGIKAIGIDWTRCQNKHFFLWNPFQSLGADFEPNRA